MTSPPISFNEIIIDSDITAYAVNIEELNTELIEYLDIKLISICKGKRDIQLASVKSELLNYLNKKNSSNLLTGSVSEFFIHLFLNFKDFKQEFLYFNLEGNDIKKGFDGYYTKNSEEWVLESKASIEINKKHKTIVNIGYTGVKAKIETIDSGNNPWENAYNHADLGSVGANKKLLDKLSLLSENYTKEIYGKIEDYNIMVASTIFLEDNWSEINIDELRLDLFNYLEDKSYNSIIVICLNKKSISHLQDYLKM
jgi:hypothetical protein